MECLNCGSPLLKEAKFCSRCGQSVVTYDKPLRPVMVEMLHETLDIDGRLFTTLKTLLSKPGELSVAYREGQRVRYTPPLRMYLVISILFFLLLPWMDPGSTVVDNANPLRADLYSKIMFFLMPFFALLLTLLFRSTYYVSNLVFSIHIHCVSYLFFSVVLLLEAREANYPFLIAFQVPFFVYLVVYVFLALKRYYAQSWRKIVLKCFALILLYSSLLGVMFDFILENWFK